MKKFLINLIVFLLSIFFVISGYALYYLHTFHSINKIPADNAIFIWGDSQANKGFDLDLIRKVTGKKVYSAARGGAGVYDFLVFTDAVPPNASVVLSISPLAQIRGRDKNNAGIPVKYLLTLYSNEFEDLLPSIRRNIHPKTLYMTSIDLYPYRDTLTFHEPISKFEEIYLKSGDNYKYKQNLFLHGIRDLIKKKCSITLVEFPFHPMLVKIMQASPVYIETKNFNHEVLNLFLDTEEVNIHLNSDNRMMYDLTHLNNKGAAEVSTRIFKNLTDDALSHKTKLFTINCNTCE
jgi:hypothetical protein